jgi:hypothetical protein
MCIVSLIPPPNPLLIKEGEEKLALLTPSSFEEGEGGG